MGTAQKEIMSQAHLTFGARARETGLVAQISGGIIGGLAGGVVFGMMMAMMDFLPMIAALVGSRSAIVGFLVHMVISAGIGAGLAGIRNDATGLGGWRGATAALTIRQYLERAKVAPVHKVAEATAA